MSWEQWLRVAQSILQEPRENQNKATDEEVAAKAEATFVVEMLEEAGTATKF